MKLLNPIIFSMLLLFCVEANSQNANYSPREFGIGISAGYGSPSPMFVDTWAFGLQGDYQFNLSQWFSLRTNLAYAYSNDDSRVRTDQNGQPAGNLIEISNTLQAGVAPLLYGRFKKSNVFLGVNATVGSVWSMVKLDPPVPAFNPKAEGKLGIGLSPMLGFGFKVFQSAVASHALEFVFTFNNLTNFEMAISEPTVKYRMCVFQMNYRIQL